MGLNAAFSVQDFDLEVANAAPSMAVRHSSPSQGPSCLAPTDNERAGINFSERQK